MFVTKTGFQNGAKFETTPTARSRSRPRSGYSVGSSLGGSVYASTILSMEEDNAAESDDFLTGLNGLNDQQWILQVPARSDAE
jgi:hypothetical protein